MQKQAANDPQSSDASAFKNNRPESYYSILFNRQSRLGFICLNMEPGKQNCIFLYRLLPKRNQVNKKYRT
jgi:hypothetical protein